jgi:RND family efflux transporter MFP subunit
MPPNDTHNFESSTKLSPSTSRKRRRLAALTATVVAVGGAIFARFVDRVDAEEKLARTTLEAAVPSVTVIHPQAGAPDQEIVLPGYAQAFMDTPVYARTSGYLKAWRFDIGAHVGKGDLLAEIDTPEIDQQLRQARADLATAKANLQLAAITAKRNEDLLKTRSVSTQDRDNAAGTLAADKAIVQSNEGNVARLEQLQSYERVHAPFDGIITARNTDTGALIDAGANAPSKELFHLAAIDTLRVYVAVPEPYSNAAQPGATASLTLDEFPGESFHGRLVRNANAIDLCSSRSTSTILPAGSCPALILPCISACPRRFNPSRPRQIRCSSAKRVCVPRSCATATRNWFLSPSDATMARRSKSSRACSRLTKSSLIRPTP